MTPRELRRRTRKETEAKPAVGYSNERQVQERMERLELVEGKKREGKEKRGQAIKPLQ